MGGYSKEMFNKNAPPLTLDQKHLREQMQGWLAERLTSGEVEVDFLQVMDRFPGANYNDMMRVYADFHDEGFLEEIIRGKSISFMEDEE